MWWKEHFTSLVSFPKPWPQSNHEKTGDKPKVLVHLGCYNRIPQSGWLRNNRNLFLTVLWAWSPRLGCQHGQVSTCFWAADFLYPYLVEGARELCGASFIRAQIPIMRIIPSHWRWGFQHMHFGETQTFRLWQLKWGTFYKIPDQYSSKLGRFWKGRTEKLTAQGSLKRHDD